MRVTSHHFLSWPHSVRMTPYTASSQLVVSSPWHNLTASPGWQDGDLQAVMNAADLDKSGTIDYEEFIVATINLSKLEREAGCQEAFSHFDTDGDGSITRAEIMQALAARGGGPWHPSAPGLTPALTMAMCYTPSRQLSWRYRGPEEEAEGRRAREGTWLQTDSRGARWAQMSLARPLGATIRGLHQLAPDDQICRSQAQLHIAALYAC